MCEPVTSKPAPSAETTPAELAVPSPQSIVAVNWPGKARGVGVGEAGDHPAVERPRDERHGVAEWRQQAARADDIGQTVGRGLAEAARIGDRHGDGLGGVGRREGVRADDDKPAGSRDDLAGEVAGAVAIDDRGGEVGRRGRRGRCW